MFSRENQKKRDNRDVMYRSNSSLDLIYVEQPPVNGLRREYGSHGSIDVIGGVGLGTTGEKYPAMVQNYNGTTPHNQTLNTPNFIRPNLRANDISDAFATSDHADGPTPRAGASPKLRLKFHKFWGGNGHNLPKLPLDDGTLTESFSQLTVEMEEAKRRHFAHYDCQSLMANLGYAAVVRGALLSRRRNTTTGASAASMLVARNSSSGTLSSNDDDSASDSGDGRSNDLLESCPFFRNELGGEEERCVSLCWRTARESGKAGTRSSASGGWHKPRAACGLSLLEFPPGQSHWRHSCPFSRANQSPLPIESQDLGALYYRNYFYGQPHQNWFGMDEQLGPVAISIKKERVELRTSVSGVDKSVPASQLVWQYRLVVRTAELLTLRGSVLEDALPTVKPTSNSTNYNTKDVLEYVASELQLSCLRLGVSNNGAEEQLLRLDEQCVTRHYKVGVMYCRNGQSTEEEMYNNQEAGPAFVEFLQTLGQTVRLKGFDKYKAGLDNKSDSTGLYSVYTTHQGCEIMLHVSTMLPYTPNNRQQLLRKRHVGNDIVTIVFQEPGAAPFTPRNIRSQFQHVFVVVRAIDPCTDNTHYSIAVSRAKEVPLFGPPIKEGAVYPKGETFTELLLSKVINGENAAIQSPKFSTMATRTRQEYLKDLAKNYVTATALDAGQKFSIFSSLLMKSGVNNTGGTVPLPKSESYLGDALVGGALCYQVLVQDEGSGGALIDCFMGVSADSIVLVEECTRQIILVVPTDTLLGWVVCGSWTRVYYHRGECVRIRGGGDALLRRLSAIAPPGATRLHETVLERNSIGQLGFHVQPDGLVTAVEGGGPAARAGIRRGARLLEVCRAAVVTLHHEQLVDLLKTSEPVTVTVSWAGGSKCDCGTNTEEWPPPARADAQLPGRHRRAYERGLSPPRSSDSSGYGTGGSARSARRSPQTSPVVSGVNLAGSNSEVVRRRHSHEDGARDETSSPRRHTPKRASAASSSLQEELMRLMDAELGEGCGRGQVATARPAAVVSPRTSQTQPAPLPLPDAATMDWSALVHTATRAMLQICEEHQYPSMDNTESALDAQLNESANEAWNDLPTTDVSNEAVTTNGPSANASVPTTPCDCGLTARVAVLEADAAQAARTRHQLEEEVRRLRRHNVRLREESARAVRQLRRFTQWFMHTVERQ